MSVLSNISLFACGPTADEPFAFVLLMIAFIIFFIVSAVCSLFG